jgi:molybdopterin synthase sulfur carrier subunit
MQIQILTFGMLTDIFKSQKVVLEIPEKSTVKTLKTQLYNQFPDTEALHFAVAINEAYADDDTEISEGQTIALIPPVSGG